MLTRKAHHRHLFDHTNPNAAVHVGLSEMRDCNCRAVTQSERRSHARGRAALHGLPNWLGCHGAGTREGLRKRVVFLGVGAKDEPQNLEYCSNHLFRYASKSHVRKWDIIIQVVGDDHPKDLCQNALQSHCRAGKCINRGRAAKRHTVRGEAKGRPADGQKCHTLTDDEPVRPESVYMHSACRRTVHEAAGPKRCRIHAPLPKYMECRKIAIFHASRLSR